MTMEPINDISYGIIPFRKNGSEWEVFLIYQYGSAGDVFWTFPKGHPELDEAPEVAARRELFEETGLELTKLLSTTPYEQSYSFTHEGQLIYKTVAYFVGVVTIPEFQIQETEVKEAGWFSLAAAQTQLTHDSAKAMLREAVADLLDS